MNELFGPFVDNEFMRHALLAGVLVSILCACVGTFMVLRGLAFVGDALAHGVLPGIAIAMLVGAPAFAGAAVGALVMMGGVNVVQRRTRLSPDTAVGLLFVGMLALGVIITSRSASFSGDITHILFGEILWWILFISHGSASLRSSSGSRHGRCAGRSSCSASTMISLTRRVSAAIVTTP